jgi:hypothetical protein
LGSKGVTWIRIFQGWGRQQPSSWIRNTWIPCASIRYAHWRWTPFRRQIPANPKWLNRDPEDSTRLPIHPTLSGDDFDFIQADVTDIDPEHHKAFTYSPTLGVVAAFASSRRATRILR